MLSRIIGFILLASLLIAGLWYSQSQRPPLTVSGFIEADEIRLGSRIGGRVKTVNVQEGDPVQAGEVLVELDPFDLREKRSQAVASLEAMQAERDKAVNGFRAEEVAQALAKLDQASEQLRMARNGPREQEVEAARAEVAAANADLELAEERYARILALQKQGAASQESLDLAARERKAAIAHLKARTEQLHLLEAKTRPEEIAIAEARVREAEQLALMMKNGSRKEDIKAANAAVQAAEAALAAIDRQLEELNIRSPVDGTVEAIELEPGDLVGANAPVISMLDHKDLWVRCYVPENHLNLQLNQELRLRVDSFPDRTFLGKVVYVSRQGEFTPSNIQTPEERSKQVFRVKVQLTDGLDVLRPGMAADVYLEGQP